MKKLLLILLLVCSGCSAQTRPNWLQLTGTPIVDVKQFGAKGDGTTDDRASIQAAIDYCLLNGQELYFSPPTAYYRIASIHPDTVGDASPTALLIKHPTSVRNTLSIRGWEKDRGYQMTKGVYADFAAASATWSLIRNEQDAISCENITFSGQNVNAIFQDSAGAFKRFTNVTFDCGYGTTRPEYGLHIPQTYLSTIDNCLFRNATVAGLQIGDGTLVSTSTSIRNSYAITTDSNGYDIGFYLRMMVYSSITNCGADSMQTGYYIDGGVSGAQAFCVNNCGSEGTFSPVVYYRTELVIDSFYTAGTTGAYVFQTAGDAAALNPPEIRGSIRASWSAEAIASGTNRLLKGNFRVLTPGIDRSDISLSAYTVTDRTSTFVADNFSGYKVNTATGTQLAIPVAGETSGYYQKKIDISGLDTTLLTAGGTPKSFGGIITILEFNGTIASTTLENDYGITSIATSAGLLLINLSDTYASGANVLINYNSANNRTYIDYATSAFKLQ
jgi:hypothetical protein